MIIHTRDFGETEIDETKIIEFPDGVFAFEDSKRFIFLFPLGEDTYPCWMQSVDDDNLCFIVYNPYDIITDFTLDEETLETELSVGEKTAVSVFSIAVIPEDYLKTTINIKSPVVVNLDTKTGKQVILPDDYPIRFPIFSGKGE